MKTVSLFALAGIALALGACAATPEAATGPTLDQKLEKLGYKQGDSVQSIIHYSIDGWNFIDDEHLVFNSGPSRDYLITTLVPCHGLRGADKIAFTTTSMDVTTLDKLIVRDAGFSDQCPIKSIHELKRIKKDAR